MGQISYGTITIIDTGDVENIYIEYIKTNSSTSAPSQSDSGWSTNTPTWENGKYIWSRTATKYTGIVTPVYSSPVCITGGKGETGGKGDTGTAVSSITPLQYLHTSESSSPGKPTSTVTSTSTAAGQWTKAQPTWVSGKYMWTCTEVKYSNNTYAWTDPICANSMNKANSDAANAVSTANSAASTASAAAANASSALTAAQNAQTALNNYKGTNDTAVQALQSRASHFWWDSAGAHVASGTGTMSSSNVTENDPSTHGFNALMAPGALSLREKAVNLVQLATNALTFYIAPNGGSQGPKALEVGTSGMKIFNPVSSNNIALMELSSGAISFKDLSGNVQATFGNNGAIQSGNYSRGSAGTKFAAGGTKIDLINGEILTRYFRLSQGIESSVPAGAYIYGTVEAIDGKIGSNTNNYWYIGNYTDYNQNQSAAIKSYGSAFIQLGNSSTWRLATNRIHGAWNDDGGGTSGLLHYPDYNNKYWDSGLHLPTSLTDKFLYIRNAPNTEDLENLQNDLDDLGYNYWTYRFYVAGDGSVYARNIYVLDDSGNITPIGGADGAYLLKSGGTMTGSITMSNGGKFIGNLQGTADNASKVNNHTVNSDVPSGAIFTDKNVQTTQANTTKLYITGTATNGTNTGTLSYDSNVYLNTTAGDLRATTFNGYTLAAASAKGVDTSLTSSSTSTNLPTSAAVVNLIKQYLPLTGGNVTGAVSFGSSVSADELTVGDLVVNDAASFTNNLQANTINGVEVGASPKFTDTVTTVTTSGNGNAVTAITASNGKLTVTKGTTFLTSYTETDPIFVASAAHGITSSDISNWNSKTSNTGTVTSVAASGSGGITISGSPITTSGTITIGLNLSTAINGLGEGTSPANRDDYIVAQYAGGGTTTTTYHRRKLSNIFAALNKSDITTALGYTPYNSTNPNGYTSNTGTVTSVATSSPITGGTITGSGTIGHATSGVGSAVTTAGLYKFKYDTYGHVTGVTAIAKADITGLGIPAQDTTYSNASTATAGLMSAADKKKLDNIQVDSSGQAVAANVAGRWGIDVTFSDANVAQVGHANSAITASNTQAAKITTSVTSTQLAFGDVINFPYVAYDTYGHITSKTNLYFKMPAAPSSTNSATNDSDGNPINTTYIKKSIGTAPGDIIYWSASGTPVRLAKGSNGQVLKLANGVPTWGADNNDNTWRPVQNNLTSDSTTDSLSAAQGKALANGSARDNTKLPLSGGTMTGQIKTSAGSGSWLSAATNAALYSTVTSGYNAITSQATKNGRITISTYPTSDDKWYLTYFLNTRTENGNDGQLSWTPSTNTLSTNISGNAATATTASWANLLKPIASTTTAAASTWNIPSGSKQVWGERFSDSTLTYTPSGGSATTITDTGDWVMWLTPNATSNMATLNMRIDGTYYGSFSGNLSGNASTATTATAANRLTQNTEMTYAWNGINYFNVSAANQSAAKVNDTPFTNATWTHILRFNHANSTGYYTDLAVPFNANGIYYKRINGGTLQNSSTNGGWVSVLDQLNYTNYTVTKTGTGASGTWGISISGNAATATSATSATTSSKTGDSGLILYAHHQNEVNFGGTSASSAIYLGYRAMDSKPIPSKFIFGGNTGTADLQVKSIYLGSGTSSYISSTNYTGKSATSGTADLATTTTTTADTLNALYPIGVTSGATTTLKRDTSITMTGGSINATNYIMSNKATMKYDANLDAIVFQF